MRNVRETFLNVVIGERTAILELFTGEDQPLLVRWNAYKKTTIINTEAKFIN